VLASYEFVSVVHRRLLSRVFGVPVFNLYGSTETGHLLMENGQGEMKPSYGTAFLELLDADALEVGELVVTTLSNDYMPLLRYRIGDLAQRQERSYGTDYVIHGRLRDALRRAMVPGDDVAGGPVLRDVLASHTISAKPQRRMSPALCRNLALNAVSAAVGGAGILAGIPRHTEFVPPPTGSFWQIPPRRDRGVSPHPSGQFRQLRRAAHSA
jgi:hypothetical protein